MNKIGAVVVSYNSEEVLPACLWSLKANNITDVVVVDNNSQDRSWEIISKEGVKSIQQLSNKGFAAAVNSGVKAITTEFILLLNPDAKLQDNTITEAEDFLTNNPEVAVVGLLLCDSNDQPELNSFGENITPWSLITRRFVAHSLPKSVKEVGWVSGGAMLVRRQVFNQLNGLDDKFFLYWEDVDFCYRVRRAGFKVVFMPTVKIKHQRGASLDNMNKKAQLYDISADRYFYKHYSKTVWLLHRQLKRFYRLFWRQAR